MVDAPELLGCPFCGEPAFSRYHPVVKIGRLVACSSTYCAAYFLEMPPAQWNRRAVAAQVREADEWPTEEEVERIARGLTKGQEIALRVIAEHGKARISISSSRLMKHVNARAATSLVKLGLAGWYDNITACSTDLGRRVAVALSRTGSEP